MQPEGHVKEGHYIRKQVGSESLGTKYRGQGRMELCEEYLQHELGE
jgi:hypothetical protein